MVYDSAICYLDEIKYCNFENTLKVSKSHICQKARYLGSFHVIDQMNRRCIDCFKQPPQRIHGYIKNRVLLLLCVIICSSPPSNSDQIYRISGCIQAVLPQWCYHIRARSMLYPLHVGHPLPQYGHNKSSGKKQRVKMKNTL